MIMDFGDYVTEKVAAARLGELREQCARLTLLDQARRGRRGLIPRLGIGLTRLRRWPLPRRGPVPNGAGGAAPGRGYAFRRPRQGARARRPLPPLARGT